MFEGVTAELLNRLLGSYVKQKCFRPDRVSTSVYSGHVKLTELELKHDAIDFLDSPFTIRRGFVGKVEFKIPWRHLGSQPVEVAVDGVYIILKPKLELSEEERERREQQAKQNRLARHEFIKSQNPDRRPLSYDTTDTSEQEASMPTFSTRLVNKIVDNIELTIRNVHIYYEDHSSIPHNPFSLGLTLESIHMHSTDGNWERCFIDLASLAAKRNKTFPPSPTHLVAHKIFQVKCLAVYWNTDLAPTGRHLTTEKKLEEYYSRCTFVDIEAALGSTIHKHWMDIDDANSDVSSKSESSIPLKRDRHGLHARYAASTGHSPKRERRRKFTDYPQTDRTGNHYVLMPVDVTLKLVSNRDPTDKDIPEHDAELSVDRVAFNFESSQYQQMLLLYAAFDSFEKTQPYAHLRVSLTRYEETHASKAFGKRDYKLLWQYAILCARSQVHKRLVRWTPKFITERRANRLEYIRLWKRNLAGEEGVTLQDEQSSYHTPDRIRRQLEVTTGASQLAKNFRKGSRLLVGTARSYTGSPMSASRDRSSLSGRMSQANVSHRQSTAREEMSAQGSKSFRNIGGDEDDPDRFQQDGASGIVSGEDSNEDDDVSFQSQEEDEPRITGNTMYTVLNELGRQRLAALEKMLSFEDIVYFRALAENELRVEQASQQLFKSGAKGAGTTTNSMGTTNSKRKASNSTSNASNNQTGSWGGSLLGLVSWTGLIPTRSATEPQSASSSNGHVLSDEAFLAEQQRLLDILDQDLDDALLYGQATAPDSNQTQSILKFCLSEGSLVLFVDQEDLQSRNLFSGNSSTSSSRGEIGSTKSAQYKKSFFRTKAEEINKLLPEYLRLDMSGVGAMPRSKHKVAIMNMAFTDLQVENTELANGSSAIQVSLMNFEVSDPLRPNSPFARIVAPKRNSSPSETHIHHENFQPKQQHNNEYRSKKHETSMEHWSSMLDTPVVASFPSHVDDNFKGGRANGKRSGSLSSTVSQTPLFSLHLVQRTAEGRSEVAITLRVQPLEVVYNAQFIDRVNGFLQPPEALTVFEELQITAINAFSSLRTQTEAKLELAFKKKNTSVSLDVKVRAPVLIVPALDGSWDERVEDNMHCLYVDLGLLTIVDKSTPPRKRRQQFQEQFFDKGSISTSTKSETIDNNSIPPSGQSPFDVDESDFFDVYEFNLTDIQLLLVPLKRHAENSSGREMRLVDRLSLKISVHISVLPYDHTMAQIKLFAQLPSMHVHLSPEKLKALYRFAATLVGNNSSGNNKSTNYLASAGIEDRVSESQTVGQQRTADSLFVGDSDHKMANSNIETSHDRSSDEIDLATDLRDRIVSPAFGHLSRIRSGGAQQDGPLSSQTVNSNTSKFVFDMPIQNRSDNRRNSWGAYPGQLRKFGSSQSLNLKGGSLNATNSGKTNNMGRSSPVKSVISSRSGRWENGIPAMPLISLPPTSPKSRPSNGDSGETTKPNEFRRRSIDAAVNSALDDESLKRSLADDNNNNDEFDDLDLNSFYSLNDDLASVATSKSRKLYIRKARSSRNTSGSVSASGPVGSVSGTSFHTAAIGKLSRNQQHDDSQIDGADDDDSYCTAGQGDWETVVRSVRSGPAGDPTTGPGAKYFKFNKPRRSPNYKLLVCSFTVHEVRVTLSRTRKADTSYTEQSRSVDHPERDVQHDSYHPGTEVEPLPPILVPNDPTKQSSIDNVLIWLQEVRAFQKRKAVASPSRAGAGIDLDDDSVPPYTGSRQKRLSSVTKDEVLNDLMSDSDSVNDEKQIKATRYEDFPLAAFVISRMHLDASFRSLDTSVEFGLGRMVVEDLMENTQQLDSKIAATVAGPLPSGLQHKNVLDKGTSHFIAHSAIEETGFHVPESLRSIDEQENVDLYNMFSIGHPLTRFEHTSSEKRGERLDQPLLVVRFLAVAPTSDAYAGIGTQLECKTNPVDVLVRQPTVSAILDALIVSDDDSTNEIVPNKQQVPVDHGKDDADNLSEASAADVLEQFVNQSVLDEEGDTVGALPTKTGKNPQDKEVQQESTDSTRGVQEVHHVPPPTSTVNQQAMVPPPEGCFSEASVIASGMGVTPVSLLVDARISSVRIWFISDCFKIVSNESASVTNTVHRQTATVNPRMSHPRIPSNLTPIREAQNPPECPVGVIAFIGSQFTISNFENGEMEVESEISNVQLFSLGCSHGPRGTTANPNSNTDIPVAGIPTRVSPSSPQHNWNEAPVQSTPLQIIGKRTDPNGDNSVPLISVSLRRRVVKDGIVWTNTDELVLPDANNEGNSVPSTKHAVDGNAQDDAAERELSDFLFDDVLNLFMQEEDPHSNAQRWNTTRNPHTVWVTRTPSNEVVAEYSKVNKKSRAYRKSKSIGHELNASTSFDRTPPPLSSSPLPSLPMIQDIRVAMDGLEVLLNNSFIEDMTEHLLEGALSDSLAVRQLVQQTMNGKAAQALDASTSSDEQAKIGVTSLWRIGIRNTVIEASASHLGVHPPREGQSVPTSQVVTVDHEQTVPKIQLAIGSVEFANLMFLDNVGATATLATYNDNSPRNPFANDENTMNVLERLDIAAKSISLSLVANVNSSQDNVQDTSGFFPDSRLLKIVEDFDLRGKLARPIGVLQATCNGAVDAQVEFLDDEGENVDQDVVPNTSGVQNVKRWWWRWKFIPIDENHDQVMKIVVASDSPIQGRMAENHIFVVRSIVLDTSDTFLRVAHLAQSTLSLLQEDVAIMPMQRDLSDRSNQFDELPKRFTTHSPELGKSSPLLTRVRSGLHSSHIIDPVTGGSPGTIKSTAKALTQSMHDPLRRRHSTGSHEMQDDGNNKGSVSNKSIVSMESQPYSESSASGNSLVSVSLELPEIRFELLQLCGFGKASTPDGILINQLSQKLFVGPTAEDIRIGKQSPAVGASVRGNEVESLLRVRVVGVRLNLKTCPFATDTSRYLQAATMSIGSMEASDSRPSHKRWAFNKLVSKHRNVGSQHSSNSKSRRPRNGSPMIECTIRNEFSRASRNRDLHQQTPVRFHGIKSDNKVKQRDHQLPKSWNVYDGRNSSSANQQPKAQDDQHEQKSCQNKICVSVSVNQPRIVVLPEYVLACFEYSSKLLRVIEIQDAIWSGVQLKRDGQREHVRILRQAQRESRRKTMEALHMHLFSHTRMPRTTVGLFTPSPAEKLHLQHSSTKLKRSNTAKHIRSTSIGTNSSVQPRTSSPTFLQRKQRRGSGSSSLVGDLRTNTKQTPVIHTVDGQAVSSPVPGTPQTMSAPHQSRKRSGSNATSSVPPLSIPQQALEALNHPSCSWECSIGVQDVEVWSLQNSRQVDTRAVVIEMSLEFDEKQKGTMFHDDINFDDGQQTGDGRFTDTSQPKRFASVWNLKLSRCSLTERNSSELMLVFSSLNPDKRKSSAMKQSSQPRSTAVGGWYAGESEHDASHSRSRANSTSSQHATAGRRISSMLQPFGAVLCNSLVPLIPKSESRSRVKIQHNPHSELRFRLDVDKMFARTTLDELNLLSNILQNYVDVFSALPVASEDEGNVKDVVYQVPRLETANDSESGSNLAQAGETNPVYVAFNVSGAEWVIVNDAHNFSTPAFNLSLHSFDSTWYLDSKAIQMNMQIKFGLEYFNQMVSVNEPCVEPWRVEVEAYVPLEGSQNEIFTDRSHGQNGDIQSLQNNDITQGGLSESGMGQQHHGAKAQYKLDSFEFSRSSSDPKHARTQTAQNSSQSQNTTPKPRSLGERRITGNEVGRSDSDGGLLFSNQQSRVSSTAGTMQFGDLQSARSGNIGKSEHYDLTTRNSRGGNHKAWQLRVLSKDVLNLNVTESFFETYASAMNAWRLTREKVNHPVSAATQEKRKLNRPLDVNSAVHDCKGDTPSSLSVSNKSITSDTVTVTDEINPESELSPFRIQNYTGMPLRCIAGAFDTLTVVPASVTRAVGIRFGGNSTHKVENPSCITIEVLGLEATGDAPSPWSAAEGVELRIDGTSTCYRLVPKSSKLLHPKDGKRREPLPGITIMCNISRMGPTRILVVRSTLVLRNRGALPLEFSVPAPRETFAAFLDTVRGVEKKLSGSSPEDSTAGPSMFGTVDRPSPFHNNKRRTSKSNTVDGAAAIGTTDVAGESYRGSSSEDCSDGDILWHQIVPAGEVTHVPVLVAGIVCGNNTSIHVRPSTPGGGPEYVFSTLSLPLASLDASAPYSAATSGDPSSMDATNDEAAERHWEQVSEANRNGNETRSNYIQSSGQRNNHYVRTASYRRALQFQATRCGKDWATYCDVGYRVMSPDSSGILQALSNAEQGAYPADTGKGRSFTRESSTAEVRAVEAIRVLSFDPTLILTNLLVHPMTYRLRGEGGEQADGHLPVGACLRWHGVSSTTALSISFRLPGFGWSDYLLLANSGGLRPGTTSKVVAPQQGIVDAANDSSSWSTSNVEPGMSNQSSGSGWAIVDESQIIAPRNQGVDIKDKNKRSLRLYAEIDTHTSGMRDVQLYVPYWIVNRSDLPILVRAATPSAGVAARFSGTHIAAGQANEIAAMRRLRMRMHLDDAHAQSSGVLSASAGLLEILDNDGIPLLGDERARGDPLMFSYTHESQKKGRIKIRAADSAWSQAIGLDSAGTTGVVEVKQAWRVESSQPRRVYVFGVSIKVGAGKFHRTKIFSILPRFVLQNSLGRTLRITQAGNHTQRGGAIGTSAGGTGSDKGGISGNTGASIGEGLFGGLGSSSRPSHLLRPAERLPFHWQNAGQQREMSVCFDEFGWGWSGGFVIDNIGDFAVRLKNRHTHSVYILRVEVSVDTTFPGCSILVVFRPELPSLPPYRIQNLSLETLRIGQVGAPSEMHEVLLPYHSCSYTWDDLSLPRKLSVESMGHKGKGSKPGQSAVSKSRNNGRKTSRRGWLVGDNGQFQTRQLIGSLFGLFAPSTLVSYGRVLWRGAQSKMVEQLDSLRGRGNGSVLLGMYELDRLQPLTHSTALGHIAVGVDADGPTRVLSVVDARIKKSKDNGASSAGLSHGIKSRNFPLGGKDLLPEMADASFEVDVSLEGLGISVVEDIPRRELIYTSIFGLRLEYSSLESVNRALLKVAHLQVDNQLYNTNFPVMLYPNRPSGAQFQTMPESVEKNNLIVETVKKSEVRQNNEGKVSKVKTSETKLSKSRSRIRDEHKGRSILSILSWKGNDDVSPSSHHDEEDAVDGFYFGSDDENEETRIDDSHNSAEKHLIEDGSSAGVELPSETNVRRSDRHVHFQPDDSSIRLANNSVDVSGKSPSMSGATTEHHSEIRPVVECCIVSSNRYPSLDFVEYFSVLLLPLDLCLEPELLGALLNFGTKLVSRMDYTEGIVSASPVDFSVFRGFETHESVQSSLYDGASEMRRYRFVNTVLSRPGVPWNPACPVVLSGDRAAPSVSHGASQFATVHGETLIPSGGNVQSAETSVGARMKLSRRSDGEKELGVNSLSGNQTSEPNDTKRRNVDGNELVENGSIGERNENTSSSRKLYIEELHIHPVKVTISFRFRNQQPLVSYRGGVGAAIFQVSPGNPDDPEAPGATGGMFRPLRFVLYAMGASLANVDNVPLRLNALVLQHSFATHETFIGQILAHYRLQALRQAYLILGSVDLLGDPLGLVKNLGAGVMDFFYEPALGLVKSPKDFGAGIAKGTLSLFRRTVLATATSVAGVATGTVALLEVLSSDPYTNFTTLTLSDGIIQGLAGVAVAPVRGFDQEGISGLGKGALVGMLGLFTKPCAGVLRIVKRVFSAVRSTVDPLVKYNPHRVRPPRFLKLGRLRGGSKHWTQATSLKFGQGNSQEFIALPAASTQQQLLNAGVITRSSLGALQSGIQSSHSRTSLRAGSGTSARAWYTGRHGSHQQVVLREYSLEHAVGEEVLSRVNSGKFRSDGYVSLLYIGDPEFVPRNQSTLSEHGAENIPALSAANLGSLATQLSVASFASHWSGSTTNAEDTWPGWRRGNGTHSESSGSIAGRGSEDLDPSLERTWNHNQRDVRDAQPNTKDVQHGRHRPQKGFPVSQRMILMVTGKHVLYLHARQQVREVTWAIRISDIALVWISKSVSNEGGRSSSNVATHLDTETEQERNQSKREVSDNDDDEYTVCFAVFPTPSLLLPDATVPVRSDVRFQKRPMVNSALFGDSFVEDVEKDDCSAVRFRRSNLGALGGCGGFRFETYQVPCPSLASARAVLDMLQQRG